MRHAEAPDVRLGHQTKGEDAPAAVPLMGGDHVGVARPDRVRLGVPTVAFQVRGKPAGYFLLAGGGAKGATDCRGRGTPQGVLALAAACPPTATLRGYDDIAPGTASNSDAVGCSVPQPARTPTSGTKASAVRASAVLRIMAKR